MVFNACSAPNSSPQTKSFGSKQWDADTVLSLINPMKGTVTCPGYAQTAGRRCWNAPAAARVNIARGVLQPLTALDPCAAAKQTDALAVAASNLLCHHHYRENHSVADEWSHKLRDLSSTAKPNMKPEAGAPRSGGTSSRLFSDFNIKIEDEDDLAYMHESLRRMYAHLAKVRAQEACDRKQEELKNWQREKERREAEEVKKRMEEQKKRQEQERQKEEERKEAERRREEERKQDEERQRQRKEREAEKKRERESKAQAELETQWANAWRRYNDSWLKARTGSRDETSEMTIPWPVLTGKAADVTEQNVRRFFEKAPSKDENATTAARFGMLSVENLRWHPDKLAQFFGPGGLDRQTREQSTMIARVVIDLRKKARESRAN